MVGLSQRSLCRLISSSGVLLIDPDFQDGQVVNVGGLARPINDTLTTWKAVIRAPRDTEFENKMFTIDLIIPTAMPMVAPQVRFIICRIPPHPNIHPTTGEVAMDILASYWSPPIQPPTVLWSVRVLLGDPNLDDFCFKNAYKMDIKTAIITRCIFDCMYGNCYLWL